MRKSVLVLVGCLVLCAAPAWAGGAFSLFGTYGEVTESSRAFGAGARLSVGGEWVLIDLTGTWFPGVNAGEFDDDMQVMPFDLGLRLVFAPGSELRPYFGAGVTYVAVNLAEREAEDTSGFYLLAGFNIKAGNQKGFFVEAVYREAESDVTDFDGTKFEVDFGGLAGSVGFFWKF
jgi:hypothetical protein